MIKNAGAKGSGIFVLLWFFLRLHLFKKGCTGAFFTLSRLVQERRNLRRCVYRLR